MKWLDEVLIWVQALVSVCEGGNRLTLTHPDVCQLGEGVVNAHIINLLECFDQLLIGSFDLLAANGVFLLPFPVDIGPPLEYTSTSC